MIGMSRRIWSVRMIWWDKGFVYSPACRSSSFGIWILHECVKSSRAILGQLYLSKVVQMTLYCIPFELVQ